MSLCCLPECDTLWAILIVMQNWLEIRKNSNSNSRIVRTPGCKLQPQEILWKSYFRCLVIDSYYQFFASFTRPSLEKEEGDSCYYNSPQDGHCLKLDDNLVQKSWTLANIIIFLLLHDFLYRYSKHHWWLASMVNRDRISISKNLYQLPHTPDMRLANLSAQNNFTTIVNINARYKALA